MLSRMMVLLAAIFAFHAGDAHALFKCVAKDGKVTYQSEPCLEADTERKLRAPPPGSASESPPASGSPPSGSAPPTKGGWSDADSNAVRANCLRDAFASAKQGWERAGDLRAFPEAAVRQAVDTYCTCLVSRVTGSVSRADFATNPAGHLTKHAADAERSGECKMEIPMQ